MQIKIKDQIFEYSDTIKKSNLINRLLELSADEKQIILEEYIDVFLDIYHDNVKNKLQNIDFLNYQDRDISQDKKYILGLTYYQYVDLEDKIVYYIEKQIKLRIEAFYERHLDKINWKEISKNPNISDAFCERYLDKLHNEGLSRNYNISEEFFRKHPEKIYWDYICFNKNISERFFEENIDKVNWTLLCRNAGISEKFFAKYIDKLDWNSLVWNDNPSIEFLEQYGDKYIESMKYNDYLPLEMTENFIKNHINDPFVLELLPYQNVSESFLEQYIHKINWSNLCKNTDISEEFFERYIDKVDWKYLSRNTNISEEFFERYVEKVDWFGLCTNINISEVFFTKYIDRVNWKTLSGNTNISEEFFALYLDKIDWEIIANNKNISIKFLLDNKDKISYRYIIMNRYILSDPRGVELLEEKIRENPNNVLYTSYSYFTEEFIERNIDILKYIPYNNKISIEFIEKYMDIYNLNISSNSFESYIDDQIDKILSIYELD